MMYLLLLLVVVLRLRLVCLMTKGIELCAARLWQAIHFACRHCRRREPRLCCVA